jgi:IS605 OrfB family transposase
MLRTASIKLIVSDETGPVLEALQGAYTTACNALVPVVQEHRCWNRTALHQRTYRHLRATTPLGSQMTCNAIFSVCKAYKSLKKKGRIQNNQPVPGIRFKRPAVHYDKKTYTLKNVSLSLYTLTGRMTVQMAPGEHQQQLLSMGLPKEAELVCRNGQWYFNLVVEIPDPQPMNPPMPVVMGVDVGENNLAATSTGQVYGGGALRHRRDQRLALRRRLQSNGSQSAKQRLRQVSGTERRRVTHINHETSRAIVREAHRIGATHLALEDLTDIRQRIKAGKRMRARLHRWAFRQLQSQIEYKAEGLGITVLYVDPAYTSQTCSECRQLGTRQGTRFACSCGFQAHADCNASRNLAWIGASILASRASVNTPDVGRAAHRSAR